MRFGLRFSLLLLLGAVMLVSYLPLFFASSAYTRLGLERLQRENAIKLGRSVAAHLVAVRKHMNDEAFLELARAQVLTESVHALSVLSPAGTPLVVLGDPDLLYGLRDEVGLGQSPEIREVRTGRGAALLVYQPSVRGGIAAMVRVDPEVTQASKLSALMGLYMGVGAFAMLVVTYFALTRWIVRPIVLLERGAERVAQGARRIAPLQNAPRELAHLSSRLEQMTAILRDEEESLRHKIEEVKGRTEDLRLAQQSLKHSERLATVGRLAAGLAHEVGNPISALIGLVDLMLTGELSPEEQKDFLERMRKETARIDRVLRDLLAYARAEKPRALSGATACAVEPAVQSVLSLLAPQSDFRELTLDQQMEAMLPLVPLSQEELTQVLLNLLMNAADACQHSGTIVIRAESQGELVRIEVEDTGPGISEHVLETLFEPFVTTKDVGKGTGLGLSVTKGLIEGAGGTIEASNIAPHGARFVIRLPQAKDFQARPGDC